MVAIYVKNRAVRSYKERYIQFLGTRLSLEKTFKSYWKAWVSSCVFVGGEILY